ncbi:MAG: sigma-70 family RNA polymerase sigma factor [Lachnospiraceae bacterium]|nr:sigma-70 family RNA polymerase sigma factor [Lachnospiraceae bacterium]
MTYQEAVAKALEKDQKAWDFLVKSTWNEKFRMASQYMKNDEDARDVLQDAYLNAWRNLSSLKEPEKFPAWLARIVANCALRALKEKKPLLFSELTPDDKNTDASFSEWETADFRREYQPEHAYTDQETSFLLKEMIDGLSDEQRLCVLMHYVEEQSAQEIAEAAGCSRNTVLSRLNYGRKHLKAKAEELEKKGFKLYGLTGAVLLRRLVKGIPTAEESGAALRALEMSEQAVLQLVEAANAVGNAARGISAAGGAAAGSFSIKLVAAAVAGAVVIGSGAYGVNRMNTGADASSNIETNDTADTDASGADEGDTGTSGSTRDSGTDSTEKNNSGDAASGAATQTILGDAADDEAFADKADVNVAQEKLDPEVMARFEAIFASLSEDAMTRWVWFDDDEYPDLMVADPATADENGRMAVHLFHGDTALHLQGVNPSNGAIGDYVMTKYKEGFGPVSYLANGKHAIDNDGTMDLFVPRRGIIKQLEVHNNEGAMQVLIGELGDDGLFRLNAVLERDAYTVDTSSGTPKRVDLPEGEYVYYKIGFADGGLTQEEITKDEFESISDVGPITTLEFETE